ncbi:MAG: PIN domain-containing protein, partial [Candidatus Saccharibacteria bacterium]|nr:PIN domain-containing protein [Candidatus Saccharibacteria bacterium]
EHIDTNIVIRLIVGDDPKNYLKAKKLISKKHKVFVFEDVAMMEVVFVLSKIYQYSRQKVADGINFISSFENIYFNKGLIEDALNLYVKHPKLSFVDCYLAAAAELSQEKPLWTLDKKLAAQALVAKLI